MLTGGSQAEGIKPHTADQIVAIIARNDARIMKT
jgi:hypothetical protein